MGLMWTLRTVEAGEGVNCEGWRRWGRRDEAGEADFLCAESQDHVPLHIGRLQPTDSHHMWRRDGPRHDGEACSPPEARGATVGVAAAGGAASAVDRAAAVGGTGHG